MNHITRIIRKDARRRSALSRFDALHEMSDEDLMEHFQAGVVEAYNILWERWTGPLVNFLYRFTGDKKACEDLIQETFLRVYRNRHSYKRIAKFSTWLYTIAGNLAKTEYRKRSRRRMDSIQSFNRDGEEFEMPLPDETFSPLRHAEGALLDHFIQMGILALPYHFREVVILRDIQQLTYEEIGDITGLPMGTVKSRINRGRTKLQDLLQGIYPFKDEEDDVEEDEALPEYA